MVVSGNAFEAFVINFVGGAWGVRKVSVVGSSFRAWKVEVEGFPIN